MSYEQGLVNQIYMSFDNGATWADISNNVKWDTVQIDVRASNEEYYPAQSTASFSVIYESALYNDIINATEDMLVLMRHNGDTTIPAGTLGSFTLGSQSLSAPFEESYNIFKGHASYAIDKTYNGILDNTIISISVTDSLDLLDVPCGDIVYRSTLGNVWKICNPANPSLSIVHNLVEIAGFDATAKVNNSFVVDVEIPVGKAIAPISEDDSVKDVLTTLLYEYGYTLHLDETDRVTGIPWIHAPTETEDHIFTDTDTMIVSESRNSREYEGLEVTYYEQGLGVSEAVNGVIVYRDSNMPYDTEVGGFEGLTIIANTKYPFETNVTDETTGQPQVVEQEYSTDGISYMTNKAVTAKLGYNPDAFSSDFSSIIATYDHYLSWKASNPAVVVDGTPSYGNKKAIVKFKNTSLTTNHKLYYFNIYAKMIYKTAERKVRNSKYTNDKKLDKYEAKFIFDKDTAKEFVNCKAEQYRNGNSTFSFGCLDRYAVGMLVKIELGDGTDVYGKIIGRSLQNSTGIWTYNVKKYSLTATTLTSQKVRALSTTTQQVPVESATTSNNVESTSGVDPVTNDFVEGSLKQVSTNGGIRFYKYVSGNWVEVGGFDASNIQFETGDASIVLAYDGMALSSTATNSILIGNEVGKYKTSGNNDILIGRYAGRGAVGDANTGGNNVGIGLGTLQQNTSGQYNIAVGYNALNVNGTGLYNVGIGYNALLNSADNDNNIAIGYKAMGIGAVSGTGNIGIGSQSLEDTTTGYNNISIGTQSALNLTTGYDNIAIGKTAIGLGTCTGYRNIAIGTDSLLDITSGRWNVAIGMGSLSSLTSGDANIAIGVGSMLDCTTGSSNVGVGNDSLPNITTGIHNIAIGNESVRNVSTGSYNIGIGLSALALDVGGSVYNGSNSVGIGYNTRVSGSNEVQIGNSSTSQTVYASSAITTRSDIRDKADIQPTSFGLDFIKKIKPVEFRYDYRDDYIVTKEDGTVEFLEKDGSKKRNRFHQGFIAQQVKQVADEIGIDFSGYLDSEIAGGCDVKYLKYEYFIAPIVKAIQELTTIVETQQKAIEDLQTRLSNC